MRDNGFNRFFFSQAIIINIKIKEQMSTQMDKIELTRISSGSMSDKLISPMSISPLDSIAECMLIGSGNVSDTSADER